MMKGPMDLCVKEFYEENYNAPVIIEGPEHSIDRSYKWVSKCEDLMQLEKGIPINEFLDEAPQRNKPMEFRILRRITETQVHVEDLSDCLDLEINKQNRYGDILPYKQNAVAIDKTFADNKGNYINASFINSMIKRKKKTFIATQAPNSMSIEAFWEMIKGENVKIIFMLCNITEKEGTLCEIYWPEEVGGWIDIFSGAFSVYLRKEDEITDALKKLTLEIVKEGEENRIVHQYQFHKWEDNSGIPVDCYDSMCTLINEVKENMKIKGHQPIVVHCSAGIGRTGTFIGISNIITGLEELIRISQEGETLEEGDSSDSSVEGDLEQEHKYSRIPRISIFSTIRRLREQRWSMVKLQAQYESVYDFMLFWMNQNNQKYLNP